MSKEMYNYKIEKNSFTEYILIKNIFFNKQTKQSSKSNFIGVFHFNGNLDVSVTLARIDPLSLNSPLIFTHTDIQKINFNISDLFHASKRI